MPRSHRYRRQEVRARRRQVRRSLNLFMLEEDPDLFEEEVAEPLSELVPGPYDQDRLFWLARDIAQDD